MRRDRVAALGGIAVVLAAIVIVAIIASSDDDTAAVPSTSTTIGPATTAQTQPSTTSGAVAIRFDQLSELAGTYTGNWESAALGGGSATLDLGVDAAGETVTVAFALEGRILESLITELAPTDGEVNVMGGVDAVFADAGTASGTGDLIGDYEMTLTTDGVVAMNADDVPGPHVDGMEVSGQLEPDCFTLDYRITFEGTDTVLEGSIELCRTEDGIIVDGGGPITPTRTIAEYSIEVLDQSAVDPVAGTGTTTGSITFECADGRCDGGFAVGQITYPDGTAQRGGYREFTFDPATETYSFDETIPGACDQERWYGTITPTDFDDRGPTAFTFDGGHDGSGGCDYQLVYMMSATRLSVTP